jgi:hypothetical protein
MAYIIKIGVIGFISSKVLKQFGKKDISDIIMGVTCLYVGAQSFILLNGWANDLGARFEWMNKVGEFIGKIF